MHGLELSFEFSLDSIDSVELVVQVVVLLAKLDSISLSVASSALGSFGLLKSNSLILSTS